MKTSKNRLQLALKGNASFSSISGFLLIIFPDQVSNIMEQENPLVFSIIGIGLLLFVALILYTIKRKNTNYLLLKSIIIQDLIWVIASILLLLFDPFNISFSGKIIVSIVACIVFYFALLQYKYAK